MIQADGELQAPCLQAMHPGLTGKDELTEVDRYLLEEPTEFSEYIIFGQTDSTWPEKIMASYQTGRFITYDHIPYQPGVCLYIDNHLIITDGLAARDGLHLMKVHHRLPLEPYMRAAIGRRDVSLLGEVLFWTPETFVAAADNRFRSLNGTGK